MKKSQLILKSSINKTTLFVFLHFFLLASVGATKLIAQVTSPQFIQGNDTLIVYKEVPGLAASDKYTLRVRSAATNNEWVNVFTNSTYNRANELDIIPLNGPTGIIRNSVTQAYARAQSGWSHTYGNIEMNVGQIVEVEIAAKNGFKIGGQDFFKAKVHPAQKASIATLNNGKIYFTITNPAQIYIDINGQMDDYNQAINPIGHAVHAISLFANPVIKKPSLTDLRTRIIEPGTTLAAINAINPASYDTMYFKQGVHDIGSGIKVHPGKTVYIPGDAFIYGTFNNIGVPAGIYSKNGENITIYGYGTICGAKIPHYEYEWYYPEIIVDGNKALGIKNGVNVKYFGVTLSDGAEHSVDGANSAGTIKWLKTITWRANGDGLGGIMVAEDCFIRTQDDCSYVKASKKRCTFWKDNNAALFHMANIPENGSTPIILEDCDVLYARLRTNPGTNGGGFQQRGEGTTGQRNVNLIVKNFRFHDKLVNMSLFNLVSFQGTSTAPTQVGSSYSGILFQNIAIAGMASGNKQRILGCAAAPWHGGIIFDNLTIGGTLVTPGNHTTYFNTNEFVQDIWFRMPIYYTIVQTVNPLHGTTANVSAEPSRFAQNANGGYMENSTVTITATALPGYKFTNWSGDVISTTNPLSVEMNSNKNITANFEFVGFKTLTANSSGNGTVETTPTGSNQTINSTVTLTAKPAIGYKFNGWSGDLNNQDIISSIVMDTDKTVTANFIKTNDFAINYGGDQYITNDGVVYAAGQTQVGTTFTTTINISNTADPVLYQSEKFGQALSYVYPVDNGKYSVTLKFAELSVASSASRRFNILLEGTAVLNNFHIEAEAEGNFIAIDKTFQTTVSDGNLNINLNRVSSSTNNAKISAIQITRIPEVIPTFTAVLQYCYGETLTPLPTTSNNGITGTWLPALNNTATTTYTFSPTAGQNATTATLEIVVNTTELPTASANQNFSAGATLANVVVTGSNLKWYNAMTSGTMLPSSTPLVNGTTYYVSQTANACESGRVGVTITTSSCVVPTLSTVTAAPACLGGTITIVLSGLLPNTSGVATYTVGNSGLVTQAGTSNANGMFSFTTPATANLNGLDLTITKITTTAGCETVFTGKKVTLVVNPLPTLTTVTTSPTCAGSAAMIVLSGLNPNTAGVATYKVGGGPLVTQAGTSDANGTFSFPTNLLPADANGVVIEITKLTTLGGCVTNFTNKKVTLVVNRCVRAAKSGSGKENALTDGTATVILYPNPATDVLNIEASLGIQSVEILNNIGQRVLTSTQKQINVSDLPSGVYLVRIQDLGNNVETKRIIIK